MNHTKNHPSVGGKITGVLITCGVLGAVAAGLSFFLHEEEYKEISDWMLIAFFVLIPVGVVGASIMLYSVRCPDCGGMTKTIKNKEVDMWQAHCPKCGVTWNLGLGTNVDP